MVMGLAILLLIGFVSYFGLDHEMKTTAILLGILFGCCVSLEASAQEWVELFNGKDLTGWEQRGGKAEYSVKDGVIVGSTVPNTPNSFLCTKKNYGDFELELEFKVHPELNSGVQIRSNSLPEYKNGRVHGYQVEIDPSERAWSGGIYDESRRGWINDLKQNVKARYAFKQNEWNHYRILANGNSIKTWVNGVPAADLTDDETATGFIGLQVHGVGGRQDPITVSWRNIRLRELESTGDEAQEADKQDKVTAQVAFPEQYEVVKVAGPFKFTEGPAIGPNGKIYFSDIPNSRIHVIDPTTGTCEIHRNDSNKANGLAWTPNDGLIACEGGAGRVTIEFEPGVQKTLVDRFEGKRFNSPNDLSLDGVGGFYFSDPRYGDRGDMEMDIEGVYYVNRGRQVKRVIDDLIRPNGVQLSNDGKTLYVSDTGANRIFAFDVKGPGNLANKREFAGIGSDGMTIDEQGNLYLTHGPSVHILNPDGETISKIDFPTNPANVTFAGEGNRTLFVTARPAVYSVEMPVAGGQAYANPR